MNARLLGALLVTGCATTSSTTPQATSKLDPANIACDFVAPELPFRVWRDVDQGRLVRERIDLDDDGTIDYTIDYIVNGEVTQAVNNDTVVGYTTRVADREEYKWLEPPRTDVTYFENERRVRTEIDDMSGVSAGADGKIDAVRTYKYEAGELVEEQLTRGEMVVERTTHVYENGRRLASTIEELAVKPSRIKTLVYTYENGRCLGTLQP